MKASKDSWKNEPMSASPKELNYQVTYTAKVLDKIKNGHIPSSMDDKWFIYYEDSWVLFHRSWTGHCIFMLKLNDTGIAEAWVTDDKEQYNYNSSDEAIEVLADLIANKLIN